MPGFLSTLPRQPHLQAPWNLGGRKQVSGRTLDNGSFSAPQTVNLSLFTPDILINA
jgi:hypothetical protein